ncbi:hypothetical protein BKA70DRAFT_1113702 [Coprinopsis sp. MPI-PUGE-AT-0042]|nr:hypothetical protein BKA70DRAFT_1113702 [Coprinopsis sp. MPI-PUGE-AT-0042]
MDDSDEPEGKRQQVPSGYKGRRNQSGPSTPSKAGKVFPKSAAANVGVTACALCLGRHDHKYADCTGGRLYNGQKGYAIRGKDRRLTKPNSESLCFTFQLPSGCQTTSHPERHCCSGCGSKDHGAQTCPIAERL